MQTTVAGFNDSPAEDFFFGNVISTYTRAQAIADGVLIDVTTAAKEAGFVWPVAISQGAWSDCVEWTDEDTRRQRYQDESGRLWDVVYMAVRAIKSSRREPSPVRLFPLWRVPCGGRGKKPRLKVLKMIVGPGDDTEPVITIMLPSED
jgi:hypothetical protein